MFDSAECNADGGAIREGGEDVDRDEGAERDRGGAPPPRCGAGGGAAHGGGARDEGAELALPPPV